MLVRLLDAVQTWSEPWASLMAAIVAQSVALFLLAILIARLLKNSSPAARCWLWQVVAIKMILMPLWTIPIALPRLTFSAAKPPVAAQGKTLDAPSKRSVPFNPRMMRPPTPAPDRLEKPIEKTPSAAAILSRVGWTAPLFFVWVAGVSFLAANIALGFVRLKKLLREADPADDPKLPALIDELSRTMGMTRAPRALLLPAAISPFACGVVNPTIVLPKSLVDDLDESTRRHVIAHELAHLKRRDLLWGWFPETARLLYFFNPIAHFVHDRFRLERELACDQAAMVLHDLEAADYAATLVRVLDSIAPFDDRQTPTQLSPVPLLEPQR